jgi:hypothetical protein
VSQKDVIDEEVNGHFDNLRRGLPEKAAQTPNRVPQEGQLVPVVPFAINGSDVFDSTDTMDTLAYVPDEMTVVVKARVVLSFREFWAPATAAASGGGSTSGSGGSSTPTTSSGPHVHAWALHESDTPGGFTNRRWQEGYSGGTKDFDLPTSGTGELWTSGEKPSAHDHTVTISAHDHTTPAHAHGLTYGVFKEAFPASFSVELRVYSWSGSAWVQVGSTITGLTDLVEDVDLSTYITGPGKYRLSLKSAAAQPNGGRLGCDLAGHIVGAIQPR